MSSLKDWLSLAADLVVEGESCLAIVREEPEQAHGSLLGANDAEGAIFGRTSTSRDHAKQQPLLFKKFCSLPP
jgi:hypothetical protein